jgi:DNA-binding transcriptional MocR family regulator
MEPGQPLATIRDLTDKFHGSSQTVAKAMSKFRAYGLIGSTLGGRPIRRSRRISRLRRHDPARQPARFPRAIYEISLPGQLHCQLSDLQI